MQKSNQIKNQIKVHDFRSGEMVDDNNFELRPHLAAGFGGDLKGCLEGASLGGGEDGAGSLGTFPPVLRTRL